MSWYNIFYFIFAGLLVWFGVRTFKRNPDFFSKENMGKSAYTMGLLAIALVVVVLLCVMIVSP